MDPGAPDARWYAQPGRTRAWPDTDRSGAVSEFHRQLPGYRPSPVVQSFRLAGELGVGRLLVKDESDRFDLGAFKFLGASWAVFRAVAARTGYVGPDRLDALREWLATATALTLVTATDGNHGRAVARMGRSLGLAVRVYVPGVVPSEVVSRITSEGARVTTVAGNYDDAVNAARRDADGDVTAVLVQDTSWDGYTEIPGWIVEGYGTLFAELDTQLDRLGVDRPGLVCVPVGVGSLAQAAVQHYRHDDASPASPRLLAVEPDSAACLLRSLRAGRVETVDTGSTIMNGLNCPTPSPLAWPLLAAGLDAAIAVSDEQTLLGIDQLAAAGVRAGPSGAAALAGARAALTGPGAPQRRRHLNVDAAAVVICISTEGPVHADQVDSSPIPASAHVDPRR